MENKLRKGDYVCIVADNGKFHRKVLWVGDTSFEWSGGWAKIAELKPNPLRRNSKFVLDITTK